MVAFIVEEAFFVEKIEVYIYPYICVGIRVITCPQSTKNCDILSTGC